MRVEPGARHVEQQQAHIAGEAEQVGVAGVIDEQLAGLDLLAGLALVEEGAALQHQRGEYRILRVHARQMRRAFDHVLVAADLGQPDHAEIDIALRRAQPAFGERGAFQADQHGGVVGLPVVQPLAGRDGIGRDLRERGRALSWHGCLLLPAGRRLPSCALAAHAV